MLDRPGQRLAGAGALLTLALTTACSEPPSYQVRWKLVDEAALDDPDAAAELSSVKQCADVGVSRVRVTTRRANNTVADRRTYPCFPGVFEYGDAVAVPALPPGEYDVEIEGLRRTGEPWTCVADPELDDGGPCVAFAEASVTISEGTLPIVEVALLKPPQCDDGIDNDGDGRVDGKDPACILAPEGLEGADANVALFQLSVSFLDNPAVEPANVSVAALRLEVDGELLAEVLAKDLDTTQWPFRLPLLTERYEPGAHQFTMVAVDGSGTALTSAFETELTVTDEAPGFLLADVVFTDADFLAPIIEPIAATVGLLLDPNDVSASTCSLAGSLASIDRVWFRVTDQNAQPLDAATLGLAGLAFGGGMIAPIDEAGGWISFACPTSMVASTALTWGNYQVEIEARIADAVCFTSDGARYLAPVGQGGAQTFNLDRIVDAQGNPPPGCEECSIDDDCSGQVCEAGLCKDKAP